MGQQDIILKVKAILRPYVKDEDDLEEAGVQTNILRDLRVNSARLVDIIIKIEDEFSIALSDEEAFAIETIGDAVGIIIGKLNEEGKNDESKGLESSRSSGRLEKSAENPL